MTSRDTIAAIATAPGRAGIGVVRVSGSRCEAIARSLTGNAPRARRASLRTFRDAHGEAIDRGLALYFPAPASYTGEDVLELHAHGSRAVLEMLLDAVLAAGARPARAGEFTERAFLEGRLDLAQAEAVADLIDAGTRQAARAAQATLAGAFSRRVRDVAGRLGDARVQIEARLDFADEDIGEQDPALLAASLEALEQSVKETLTAARQGVKLRDGLRVVLTGAPNVGKSSLLNRLAGEDRAIVTAVPGTTRDALRETVRTGAIELELVDTAGLRDSDDPVERLGMERARAQIDAADVVVLVRDHDSVPPRLTTAAPVVAVLNKIDRSGESPGLCEDEVRLSALTGDGVDVLVQILERHAGHDQGEGAFLARARHVTALEEALRSVSAARDAHAESLGMELVAEELRRAQLALDGITGVVTSDDLLGAIFSSFCIGK